MNNESLVRSTEIKCDTYNTTGGKIPLEAYAACLSPKSQFVYTITFLLLPLVFYLTEFLILQSDYEPTGLRQRIKGVWKEPREDGRTWAEYFVTGILKVANVLKIIKFFCRASKKVA